MRPDHTSPRSPSENTIRADAPRPDGNEDSLSIGRAVVFGAMTVTIS